MGYAVRTIRRSLYRLLFIIAVAVLLRTNNKSKYKNDYQGRHDMSAVPDKEHNFKGGVLTQLEKDEIALALGEYNQIKDHEALHAEMKRLHDESMKIMHQDMAIMGKNKMSTDMIKQILENTDLESLGIGESKSFHDKLNKAIHEENWMREATKHLSEPDLNPTIAHKYKKDDILNTIGEHQHGPDFTLEKVDSSQLREIENRLKRTEAHLKRFEDKEKALEAHQFDLNAMKESLIKMGVIHDHEHDSEKHKPKTEEEKKKDKIHKDAIHNSHGMIEALLKKGQADLEEAIHEGQFEKAREAELITAKRLHQLKKMQESEKVLHMDMDAIFNMPEHEAKAKTQNFTSEQLMNILHMDNHIHKMHRHDHHQKYEELPDTLPPHTTYIDLWTSNFNPFPYVRKHNEDNGSDRLKEIRAAMTSTQQCMTKMYTFHDLLTRYNDHKTIKVCPTVELDQRSRKNGYVRVLSDITPDDELLMHIKNKRRRELLHNPDKYVDDHADEHKVDEHLNKLWKTLVHHGIVDPRVIAKPYADKYLKTNQIPNIYHAIWFKKHSECPEFKLENFLSLVSVLKIALPKKIIFHTNCEPKNELWEIFKCFAGTKLIRFTDNFIDPWQ